jgi:hypothetical protein
MHEAQKIVVFHCVGTPYPRPQSPQVQRETGKTEKNKPESDEARSTALTVKLLEFFGYFRAL